MKYALVILVAAVGFTTTGTATASVVSKCPVLVKQVHQYRGYTRKLERKMGMTPSKSSFYSNRIHSCKYVKWVRAQWKSRYNKLVPKYKAYLAAKKRYVTAGWLTSAFLCIHRYEGAWNANTGNGYYGGLQMDYGFMRAYGGSLLASKGTADNWTPSEQIAVAARAHQSGRGFTPWPNTARACGLL